LEGDVQITRDVVDLGDQRREPRIGRLRTNGLRKPALA
jgi:hypothetical protein